MRMKKFSELQEAFDSQDLKAIQELLNQRLAESDG